MKKLVLVTTLLSLPLLAGHTLAGDAEAGKKKATTCIACHGKDGISPNDIWPNLAGQKKGYLIKQIKAFRDGDRKEPLMQPMVKNLTDQDIEDIAEYYSKLGQK